MSEQRIYPSVGDYITVLDHIDHPSDHSWVGDVLKVTAVDAPFIAAELRAFASIVRLDMRRVNIMRLSDAYVAAVLGAAAVTSSERVAVEPVI